MVTLSAAIRQWLDSKHYHNMPVGTYLQAEYQQPLKIHNIAVLVAETTPKAIPVRQAENEASVRSDIATNLTGAQDMDPSQMDQFQSRTRRQRKRDRKFKIRYTASANSVDRPLTLQEQLRRNGLAHARQDGYGFNRKTEQIKRKVANKLIKANRMLNKNKSHMDSNRVSRSRQASRY